MAVLASLSLAAPALAAGPPEESEPSSEAGGECTSNCTYELGSEGGEPSAEPAPGPEPSPEGEPAPASEPAEEDPTSANSTSPPTNSTSGSGSGNGTGSGSGSSGAMPPVHSAIDNIWYSPAGGSCDIIRPTGTGPYVSVNPILGLFTVNTHCILRAMVIANPNPVYGHTSNLPLHP